MDNLSNSSVFSAFPRLAKLWLILRPFIIPDWFFNRKVEVTKTGYVYIGIIVAVAVAALNTGNNLLFLVLAMLISALIGSFLISEYMIAELFITRSAPRTVTEGVSFRVAYLVKNNKSLIPSFAVRITEKLGDTEAMALVTYVGPGGEVTVKGPALAESRGRLKFHDMTVSTSAPFGWFNKHKRVPLGGELIALPRPDPLDVDREKIATRGEEKPINRPGRGDDLFGFRKYVRGDPVKDIHWKTTARLGEFTVREREAESERRFRIALDLSGPRPERDDPEREAAVRKAASLAAAAIEDGWQVRVESAGKGVHFGSGPGHLWQILTFLALFDDPEEKAGSALPPVDLAAIIIP